MNARCALSQLYFTELHSPKFSLQRVLAFRLEAPLTDPMLDSTMPKEKSTTRKTKAKAVTEGKKKKGQSLRRLIL